MTPFMIRMTGWLARARRKAVSLYADRRGVAAVEFALIAPILLALYFVTMEVSQGIESNKKVGRVASMVADLVTQQPTKMPREELDAIMRIGNAILYPYERTRPTIEVVAISIPEGANPQPVVAWSRKMANNSFTAGPPRNTPVTIPDTLKIPGTFLVRVSAQLDYRPVVTWAAEEKASMGLAAAFDRIPMTETYYLRPRMGSRIDCDACIP